MKFKKKYFIGISLGLIIWALDFIYFFREGSIGNGRWFFAVLIVGLSIGWMQFWIDFVRENKRQKDIEEKFLEFLRGLLGSVKVGIPIPQSLIQISQKEYGNLTSFVRKLGNQIQWGIPINEALTTFAIDTDNHGIKRSVSLIIEAEQSGGDTKDVIESVTRSIEDFKKMKEERRAGTYSQIIQGYIVFFIFIGIMLLMQLKLFPLIQQSVGGGQLTQGVVAEGVLGKGAKANMDTVFFALLMIQGFFAGIMIGKFSEGTLKQGLLHSIVLTTLAALIVTTVKGGI